MFSKASRRHPSRHGQAPATTPNTFDSIDEHQLSSMLKIQDGLFSEIVKRPESQSPNYISHQDTISFSDLAKRSHNGYPFDKVYKKLEQ